MSLSQQARTILTAIQTGANVIQVYYTPEAGEERAGIARPGGVMQQTVPRRTVDMLRRHSYITLVNEWPLGHGRIAAEDRITESGLQALPA